jgi:hypothetical protein
MSNDAREKLDTVKHDAQDAVDEAKHRIQAAGERFSRDVQGDTMPIGERLTSHVKETLHKTKAEFDAAKRDARHAETDPDRP